MPRTARLVVPNYVHHITPRGNYYQNIFQDDEDRFRYLFWIKKTYLAGASIWNKGVNCEVRENGR